MNTNSMITNNMIFITQEMNSFGVTPNAAFFLSELLSDVQIKGTNDPRMIISKDNFKKITRTKNFRTVSKYLDTLENTRFIELEINKGFFTINIMPFLLRLEELQNTYDKRMKDTKHPFPDQYG